MGRNNKQVGGNYEEDTICQCRMCPFCKDRRTWSGCWLSSKAVKSLKGYTSKVLRSEYPSLKTKMPSLWTNSYFVSTVGGAPLDVIKQYIENQKTSQRQKDKLG